MTLPIELWLRILIHVARLPKKEIAAMALCSRFFSHELRPRLFQTITMTTLTRLQSWERIALESQKPPRRKIATLFLRWKERQVVHTEGWVPPLHLIQNLGVSIYLITVPSSDMPARVSEARRVLAACPNIDTLFFDYGMDWIIGMLLDNPNITRLFFAGDNMFKGSILAERRHGFQNLTHLWVHDLLYFSSAVVNNGSTVAPDVFPALTHVVAGSDIDIFEFRLEDRIARAVREVLRFNRLQRFLFLFPFEDGQPRIQIETTPLWRSLVALRDPRVCVMAVPQLRESTRERNMPILRWNALTRSQTITWESGIPVWNRVHNAKEMPRAATFVWHTHRHVIGLPT